MTRARPANRRAHEVIAIEHDRQRYKIGLGRDYRDRKFGPVIEVFLNAQQVNSYIDILCNDGSILMSLLLQHGCDPETIFHAMKRNADGSMASPLGRASAYLVEGER
jgi:hypothetical protein